MPIRDRARQQFARGEWEDGIATANEGFSLQKDDAQLQKIVNDALASARREVTIQRGIATAIGRYAVGTTAFQTATRRQRSSDQLQQSGDTTGAIRSAWEAVDLFRQAQTEGRRLAQAEAEAAKAAAAAPPPAAATPQQPPPSPAPPPPAPAAAPAASAPPAAAAAPPPSRPPQVSEEPAIRSVLNAYTKAYSDLDADAVRRLYPTVNYDVVKRGFEGLKSQQVQIQDAQIVVTGSTAIVSCRIVTAAAPRVGSPRTDARAAVLRLEKRDSGWVIVQRQ